MTGAGEVGVSDRMMRGGGGRGGGGLRAVLEGERGDRMTSAPPPD